jgi:hypothetical protein
MLKYPNKIFKHQTLVKTETDTTMMRVWWNDSPVTEKYKRQTDAGKENPQFGHMKVEGK